MDYIVWGVLTIQAIIGGYFAWIIWYEIRYS